MNTLRNLVLSTAIAAITLASGFSAPAALADDTEVFFVPVSTGLQPNILFIVDSSQTMGEFIGTTLKWSPKTNWIEQAKGLDTSFNCRSDRLYWTNAGLTTRDCSTLPYIEVDLSNPDDLTKNKFVCKAALDLLRANDTEGYVRQAQIAQYDKTNASPSKREWKSMQGLRANGDIVLTDAKPGWITECLADDDKHGIDTVSAAGDRPNNGTADGFGLDADADDRKSPYLTAKAAFGGSFTFYTANRIAFELVRDKTPPPEEKIKRIDAVKDALKAMITSVENVNVGLMRFDNNAAASRGGMVVHEMQPLGTGRQSILDTLFKDEACKTNASEPPVDGDCMQIFEPWGNKSIGETLWEAYLYYSGGPVDYGGTSNIDPNIPYLSVPESLRKVGNKDYYISPVSECSKNYIVLLTDGLTTQDTSADVDGVAALPNFNLTPEVDGYGTNNAKCDKEDIKVGPTGSDCVDDLPAWMFRNDVNTTKTGVQNVKTFTIGFDLGLDAIGQEARAVLRDAARRGGGQYYDAVDQKSLEVAFDDIIRLILLDNASFTAPSVAVNAFNRTQNLNDLYMSVFKPALSYRWIGNIKKYRITAEGDIVDNSKPDPKPAVDAATGFFTEGTQSFWSSSIDGADAALGGAASRLTDPLGRRIFTNVSTSAIPVGIKDSGALATELSALKSTDLATAELANKLLFDLDPGDPVPAAYPSVTDLIDWAYGVDVQDKVGAAGTSTDPRLDMGDPLHSRPATVIYGGTATSPKITLFATTNDGILHAIDAATGDEIWAFAPAELLTRLLKLYNNDGNAVDASREYGLDGSIRAYRIDKNQDGTIDSEDGDRVLLFFGMRRGGSSYYGLDVTNSLAPESSPPELLWRIGTEDLPFVGQTWSTPVVARMNIDRGTVGDLNDGWSHNPNKLVLVMGGGYDPTHDTAEKATTYSHDSVGNRIYIVDAISGDLLWRAGPSTGTNVDSGAQLTLADMRSAIPGDVRVFDLTGDGFEDRMYASDLGGRVWRFDIINGNAPADLVKGGVFATLGGAHSPGAADQNRKFFYAPDPALVRYGGRSWINIAIGSGDRERPVTERDVQNRFFSLRDYNVFQPIEAYESNCTGQSEPCHQIITSDDTRLSDATNTISPTLATNTVGWYMNLVEDGEKALAESRTFQNAVYFTTYAPREREFDCDPDETDPTKMNCDCDESQPGDPDCAAQCGLAVGVSQLYVVNAITSAPIFDYNRDGQVGGASGLTDRSKELAQGSIAPEVVFVFPGPETQGGPAVPPVCLVGLETCGGGVTNPPVRTYWRQRGVN